MNIVVDRAQHPPQLLKAGNDAAEKTQSVLSWVWPILPIAYLWFQLINNLRLEWGTNPQYSYGWTVPVLCLGLISRRWQVLGKGTDGRDRVAIAVIVFAVLAFLYLPTRLIESATPEWRPIQWSLGVEAVGLTLCGIYLARGGADLRELAFSICFVFVAIPWPTLVEAPLIQSLTRVNTGAVIEVLGLLGVPAIQHGNTIELSVGSVGVSEACSGIRSFQTSLMISLFFGEFYRMIVARRLLLVPVGFVLAMAFNVCRVTILSVVAARKGIDAIADYHDPAGVAITIVCTAGLWLAAWFMRPKTANAGAALKNSPMERPGNRAPYARKFLRLGVALLLWIICVEAGVEAWYRIRESRLKAGPGWSFAFPEANASFKALPINESTKELLRFDEGREAAWEEADGSRWQAFFCSWRAGRVAGYLAKRHTPEICLPANGQKMVSGPTLKILAIHDAVLPIRSYVFEVGGRTFNVFHCRWEAGVDERAYVEHESARYNLIRGIWAGRGNHGQKVLEIVVSGYADPKQAEAALARELEKAVVIEKPAAALRSSASGKMPSVASAD